MSEKLIIENFAGISYLEIEVKPITILIGEQTTGKSVVAKLIYYFKEFIPNFFESVANEQTKKQFEKDFLEKFQSYFPFTYPTEKDFSLRYQLTPKFVIELIYSSTNQPPKLNYPDYLSKQRKKIKDNIKKITEEPRKFFVKEASPQIIRDYVYFNYLKEIEEFTECKNLNFRQLFIPASRSFFTMLEKNIFGFLLNNIVLDPFLKHFGSNYQIAKGRYREAEAMLLMKNEKHDQQKELFNKINQLFEAILKGSIITENQIDYILHKDNRKVEMSYASSGQQEIYPLSYILKAIPLSIFREPSGYFVYVEEPEAHIFPTAQKQMVELITTLYNIALPKPVHFVITTHSPYILTSFNNLIEAHTVSQKLPENEHNQLEKIVPKEQWLDFDHVQAYALSGGTGQSIMDAEYRLITADLIDSVSENIAIQFDQLLDLKYEEKEEKSE